MKEQIYREGRWRERSPSCSFTPQVAIIAWAEPIQSQESGTSLASPMQGQGPKIWAIFHFRELYRKQNSWGMNQHPYWIPAWARWGFIHWDMAPSPKKILYALIQTILLSLSYLPSVSSTKITSCGDLEQMTQPLRLDFLAKEMKMIIESISRNSCLEQCLAHCKLFYIHHCSFTSHWTDT